MTLGISIKCPYTECRYAECHVLFIVMLSIIRLNVVILSVVVPRGTVVEHSTQIPRIEGSNPGKRMIVRCLLNTHQGANLINLFTAVIY
jgi:hypothetical protein